MTGTTGRHIDPASARGALLIVWRRKWLVLLSTIILTALALIFLIVMPARQTAEAFLQIIPSINEEGMIDKDLFETAIASHLQLVKSAQISATVRQLLKEKGHDYSMIDLQRSVSINRPPRSALIRLTAETPDPDLSRLVLKTWITEYFSVSDESRVGNALNITRTRSIEAQNNLLKTQEAFNELTQEAEQSQEVVDLLKSVDDLEIWEQLVRGADNGSLKGAANVKLLTQELSRSHPVIMEALMKASTEYYAAQSELDFYGKVAKILQSIAGRNTKNIDWKKIPADTPEGAFALSLVQNRDIVMIGEPAIVFDAWSLKKKTAVAFVIFFFLSSAAAWTVDWVRLGNPE